MMMTIIVMMVMIDRLPVGSKVTCGADPRSRLQLFPDSEKTTKGGDYVATLASEARLLVLVASTNGR